MRKQSSGALHIRAGWVKSAAAAIDCTAVNRPVPPFLRYGAAVTLVQCVAVFIYIITLLIDQFTDHDSVLESESAAAGYVNIGTAVFLAVIFGFIAWVAVSTLRGTPRSLGAVMLIECILVGVAVYMFRGGATGMGVATLVTSVFVLLSLLNSTTRGYLEERYAASTGRG